MLRAAALGCCLALLLISGVAFYLATLSQYSARAQYAAVVDRPRMPQYVSAMTYSPNMKYFYFACALGWLFGFVFLRGRARVLVLAAAAAFVAWAAYATVYLLFMNAPWVAPLPIYLEQCLFPLYVAGAAAGYCGMLGAIASLSVRMVARLGWRRGPSPSDPEPGERRSRLLRRTAIALAVLAVIVLPARVVSYALTEAQAKATMFEQPWPDEPELIRFFDESIGRAVGRPFGGAINFLSRPGPTLPTLWSHGVPTLNEYSQLVAPQAFYFVHALLKQDLRGRINTFTMYWSEHDQSPTYWKTLEMLGMRYAAGPSPVSDPFNPALVPITKPRRPVEPGQTPGSWYVYELPHPNVGNYSPTEVVTAGSGATIMAALRKPEFDFTRQVVLSAPLGEPLVAAREARLSLVRGGLHVSAASGGTSLLLLPQQFSHCLRARDSKVRFLRANLLLTAMVFSGAVDTDIVFDYGLFSPGCRRADLAEMKRLDLAIDLRMPHLVGDRLFPDWAGAASRLQAAARAFQLTRR